MIYQLFKIIERQNNERKNKAKLETNKKKS